MINNYVFYEFPKINNYLCTLILDNTTNTTTSELTLEQGFPMKNQFTYNLNSK